MDLIESTDMFVQKEFSYYNKWILDEPLLISEGSSKDLSALQKVLNKLINEFVSNFSRYKHLMPVIPEVEQVIELFNRKPYQVGSYRTDFVFDLDRQIKIIEITCRMGLNGVFSCAIMEHFTAQFVQSEKIDCTRIDLYKGIFQKLEANLKDVDSVTVLVGHDKRNESKIFTEIFERMGFRVRQVQYDCIKNHLEEMQNSWIISELSFDEILSIDLKTLEALMPLNITNDFRTVFLIHDKRFFDVLGHAVLRDTVLTAEEIRFFDQYYIPTYAYAQNPRAWENAKYNKNEWILKHRALGKSQEVYAGVVTETQEWEALFEDDKIKEMVLQKWVKQPTYKTTLKGQQVNDYLTGTLLYFDDEYFGLGEFRTSSYPVTNKVDHRKMAGLIVGQKNVATGDFNGKKIFV